MGDRAPQELYDRVYREMGLDKPITEQFFMFPREMLQGRFGKSLVTGNPIAEDIYLSWHRQHSNSPTLAMVIGVVLGIPLRVLCVRYAGRLPDSLLRVVMSLVGHSLRTTWLGIVGLLVFYAKLRMGQPDSSGRLDIAYRHYSVPDSDPSGFGRCRAGRQLG